MNTEKSHGKQASGNRSPSHWPLSIVSSSTSLINLLLPIVLVRILPQESVGDYKIFFLYLSLVPAFAMIAGLVSNVPFWAGQKNYSTERLKASFQLVLASSVIFTLLGFAANSWIAHAFNWSLFQANLFAIAIFGSVGHQFIEDCLISKGRIWASAFFSASFEVAKALLLVFAAWHWNSTSAVFASFGFIMACKVLIAIVLGIKNDFLSLSINQKDLLNVARKAAPVSLAAVFSIFIDRADQFVLSNSLSAAQFAIYSLGCLVVPPLLSLETSIMRVSIPQIAAALSSGNSKQAARLHSYAVEQLALLIVPASIGLMIFAEPIVTLLFTPLYIEASGYLRVYALSYLILILPFDASARAIGNTPWIFRSFIFFSLVCVLAAFAGAYSGGAYAALAATIFAKTLMRLWGLRFSKHTLKASFSELLPLGSLLKEALLIAAISLLVLALRPLFSSSVLWLVVCGSLFVALYLPLAIILRNRAALKYSKGLKVLHVVQSLQIGGLEKMVVSLATEQNKTFDEPVQILAYDQPDLPQSQLLSEVAHRNQLKLIELKKPEGFSFFTLLLVVRLILIERINVVHTHNLGPLLYVGLAKLLTLGKFRIIHSSHSFTELENVPRYRYYEALFAKLCFRIIAVSPEVVARYKRLGVRTNLEIIPNGIDSSIQTERIIEDRASARNRLIDEVGIPELNNFRDSCWIINVARIHFLKGQDRTIQIWNEMNRNINAQPFSCLIFIGPDTDPEFAEQVRKIAGSSEHSDRIFFTGPTNHPEKWYRVADAFISCSRIEGMPLAPVEALKAGIPVILSEIEGHSFLSSHSCSLPADECIKSASLLSSFLGTLSQPESRQNIVNSTTWANQNFSVSSMAERYREIYHKALKLV